MSLLLFFDEESYWKNPNEYFIILLADGREFIGNGYLDTSKDGEDKIAKLRELIPEDRIGEATTWQGLMEMNGKVLPQFERFRSPTDVAKTLGLKTGAEKIELNEFSLKDILENGL